LDKESKTILDVGCGKGIPMQYLNRKHQFETTGIDGFSPYLVEAWTNRTHDSLIHCDVRELGEFYRRTPKIFDTVICLEVIEHLDPDEGEILIMDMERLAKRQVIISTPLGDYEQHDIDGNPYQEHKSQLTPELFRWLGYTVRGIGLKGMGGENGLGLRHRLLADSLYALAFPFVYYRPEKAGAIVAAKNLRGG
jgi:ubiquinone/menaquinone biosynthesis C-methylase UbiE